MHGIDQGLRVGETEFRARSALLLVGIGAGTHAELLVQQGMYYDLYRTGF